MSEGNFTRVRNDLIDDHLKDGEISISQFVIYLVMIRRADWTTGVFRGNAETIATHLGGQLSPQQVNKMLTEMQKAGYIKRFQVQGKPGFYPILINKFEPTLGPHKGKRLNALKSRSYKSLVFEDAGLTRDSGVTQAGDGRDSGGNYNISKDFEDVSRSGLPTQQDESNEQERSTKPESTDAEDVRAIVQGMSA